MYVCIYIYIYIYYTYVYIKGAAPHAELQDDLDAPPLLHLPRRGTPYHIILYHIISYHIMLCCSIVYYVMILCIIE